MSDRSSESREVRRPDMDRKWSSAVEAAVLDIVAKTGSPKMAAEQVGVSVATIHDHRRRDADFGARYGAAMDNSQAAGFRELGARLSRALQSKAPELAHARLRPRS